MNGIEILNTTEVGIDYAPNWWACGLAFLFCIIIAIACIIITKSNAINPLGWAILLGIIASGVVLIITLHPAAYETHYQVTIDDSVSMNEFLDKYEIVKQEGKIYTIKERE